MNILFACEYFFANPDFARLAEELGRRGHEISVVTSTRPVDRKNKHRLTNIRIYDIEPLLAIHRIPHTVSLPLVKVGRVLKEQRVDVVHTINDHSTNGLVACFAAKATSRPFVYTVQGPGTITGHPLVDYVSQLYTMTVGYWCAKEAGKVILLSKSLLSTATRLRVEKERVAVIPSGVDCDRFNRENPRVKKKASELREELGIGDEIVIGYTGRLFPAKGLAYLFSAVKKIEHRNTNITLLIVGDGAQRSELETLARDLKVRTVFAGWQSDTAPYYSLMDVFALPSLFEGLPNVLLEAMAMKLALLVTDVGGNPDVVANGENGFLVPPRDESKLASALEKMIRDDDLRTKMGEINRKKVEEHYKWSQTVSNVERVYREITQVCEPSRMNRRTSLEN